MGWHKENLWKPRKDTLTATDHSLDSPSGYAGPFRGSEKVTKIASVSSKLSRAKGTRDPEGSRETSAFS